MNKKDEFVEEVEAIMEDTTYLEEAPKPKSLVEQASKIQDPIISANQIVALLAKTPEKYIYERPAKGGGAWKYVAGGYIKKTLNRIFGWNWSFEVVDKFKEDGEVVVQGKLTIRNKQGQVVIIKEDFGKKEIINAKSSGKPLSIGNDYKSASTDCLKRCAFQLGLASDVYAPEEYSKLENPHDAIVYDMENKDGQFRVKCEVCGVDFTSDKNFLKECADCATLPKEEKETIKKQREDNPDEPF